MPDTERAEHLGLLGGTFDPPHLGHVDAARAALGACGLDRLLLVVANDPWQKRDRAALTPAADRLALAAAAAEGLERTEVCDLEVVRGGPSYTIDTVDELRRAAGRAGRPPPRLTLVIGADLAAELDSWHRAAELRTAVALAVVTRPGAEAAVPPGWRGQVVTGGGVDVSSSGVRRALARGEPVEAWVPPAVIRCIRRRGLYAVTR